MLTCRQIMTGAMRKLGVLPIGRSATAAQAEDVMEVLNSLYLELIGQGVFGKLIDTLITDAAYTPHENERVNCSSVVTTITLPTSITQEWQNDWGGAPVYPMTLTDYGRYWGLSVPRPPRDNAIIEIARSDLNTTLTYIYDGPRAKWQQISTLTLDDSAPLSERYGEALKAKLAEKLAPHFNVAPNPFLLKEIATANNLLSHRYDRAYRPVSGSYM